MRALKKINNNFALCVDKKGAELIAYGTGVGFGKFPCDVPLSKIERTYYNVSHHYQSLIVDLPEEVFQVSMNVIQRAKIKYSMELNPNLMFSLADHINFAIERIKKKMKITFPFYYDIEHLYPNELELGEFCLSQIWEIMHIRLPKQEVIGVALHFINNQCVETTKNDMSENDLENMTRIIEDFLWIKVDRESYNYYRYCSHIRYLIQRIGQKGQFEDADSAMFEKIKNSYNELYECSQKLKEYLEEQYNTKLSKEEQLYLIIHLNRLKSKQEDCNR